MDESRDSIYVVNSWLLVSGSLDFAYFYGSILKQFLPS